MTDFDQAVVKALNQCRRDGVKPVARNVQPRLEGSFAFYSYTSIKRKLHQMHQQGILSKPGDKPRGGYLLNPNIIEICPYCHRAMEQGHPHLALAN